MRFLGDMGVSSPVIEWLRAAGHDAVHLRDEGLHRLPNGDIFQKGSFNPDEFAIALEQVVAGTAPDDYKKPEQFFSRTCFTRALRENSGLVLRRLAGKTENTAPVQTLVTQMGGGKTHMLTTLWHLANTGAAASAFPGVSDLLSESGLIEAPKAKVAVFVGNAWDPQPGRETPWIDIARQLASDACIEVFGPAVDVQSRAEERIGLSQAASALVLAPGSQNS